jgi:toxin secretion/phage lysis holin
VETWQLVKGCMGLAVALIARWFAVLPEAVQLLVWVMLLDTVVGSLRIIAGKSRRKWSWSKSWRSAAKKSVTFVVIGLAFLLERYIRVQVSVPAALYCVWHYGISLLNNAAAVGAPVPPQLRKILAAMDGEDQKETVDTPDSPMHPTSNLGQVE